MLFFLSYFDYKTEILLPCWCHLGVSKPMYTLMHSLQAQMAAYHSAWNTTFFS